MIKLLILGELKKEDKTKKVEIYIPPEKLHCIKMEFQKIVDLLETTSDGKDLPRIVTNMD